MQDHYQIECIYHSKGNGLDERRQWPRYKIDWAFRIEGAGESTETGKVINISARGALLRIARKLDVGTRISLSIRLPSPADAWMRFSAQVVRVEEAPTGVDIALRFDTSQPAFTDL
jgi:hypothetical protein